MTSLAMAVAAMVARQMREQRRGEPDDTWTQEQVDLFELQRLSKATFKVEGLTNLRCSKILFSIHQSEIVLQQLEQNQHGAARLSRHEV